ncbi:hypothetical protein RRG08_050879 [Elysia crispata]|uniref:Secreted protein n=1 Tax=Elysia crispata TaxID=231223 RepID=A0AAE0ZDF6_9GAST|nr:hypothetical protein RRG08_050879 [Elysia crispata]
MMNWKIPLAAFVVVSILGVSRSSQLSRTDIKLETETDITEVTFSDYQVPMDEAGSESEWCDESVFTEANQEKGNNDDSFD